MKIAQSRVTAQGQISLPAEVRRARREGLAVQVDACVRGHWDGLLDRPLPLKELKLQ